MASSADSCSLFLQAPEAEALAYFMAPTEGAPRTMSKPPTIHGAMMGDASEFTTWPPSISKAMQGHANQMSSYDVSKAVRLCKAMQNKVFILRALFSERYHREGISAKLGVGMLRL